VNLFRGQKVSRSPGRLCTHRKCAISSEREGLRTVHRWSTKIHIANKRHDLRGQRSRSHGQM